MQLLYFFVLSILFHLLSIATCNKNGVVADGQEVTIRYGRNCGWCAGGDSLEIRANETFYAYQPACNKTGFKKTGKLAANDWNELLQSLDTKAFQSIELTSCDVCFDGCDTWVSIEQGHKKHRIQYGSNDGDKIKAIQPFLNKLQAIKMHYNPNF